MTCHFIGNSSKYTYPSHLCVSNIIISCNAFVRYEGATTIIAIEVAGLMMLMRYDYALVRLITLLITPLGLRRVKAMYRRNYYVMGGVIFLLLLETAVNIWLMTGAQGKPSTFARRRSHLTSAVRSCPTYYRRTL